MTIETFDFGKIMSNTQSNTPDPSVSDSWVDLGGQTLPTSSPISLSGAVTPTGSRRLTSFPFGGEHDYLRMLREAQRESNWSSTKVSPISSALISCKNTPGGSPKSPPNTPNPELASSLEEELKAVYINHLNKPDNENDGFSASDIIWDWSSQPNIPCKEWTVNSLRSRKSSASSKVSNYPSSKESSINTNFKKKGFFFKNKDVLLTVLITNLVSFLVGAGLGIWLSKRGVNEDILVEIGL